MPQNLQSRLGLAPPLNYSNKIYPCGYLEWAARIQILACNCQGGRSTSTIRQHLLLHLKASSPQILFLFETKCGKQHLDRLLPSLPFNAHHSILAVGLSGGLCLFWNNFTIDSIIASSTNFIIVNCSVPSPLTLVCVYGALVRKDRKRIWKEILCLAASFTKPWLCIGYFNATSPLKKNSAAIFPQLLRLEILINLSWMLLLWILAMTHLPSLGRIGVELTLMSKNDWIKRFPPLIGILPSQRLSSSILSILAVTIALF